MDSKQWQIGQCMNILFEKEIYALFRETQPLQKWQRPLTRLLQTYIIPQEANQALVFLAENVSTACRALEYPAESPQCSRSFALYLDLQHKPIVFDMDQWKRILLALHFDLTEPEGSHDIDLVEVKVTRNVNLWALKGFRALLECLSKMTWGRLTMLLVLEQTEAIRLMSALQKVLADGTVQDCQIVQDLYPRYPEQLSALGFQLRKARGLSGSRNHTEVRWQKPQCDADIQDMLLALTGLFYDGSGLETYL